MKTRFKMATFPARNNIDLRAQEWQLHRVFGNFLTKTYILRLVAG
jgi:hypothetical protein